MGFYNNWKRPIFYSSLPYTEQKTYPKNKIRSNLDCHSVLINYLKAVQSYWEQNYLGDTYKVSINAVIQIKA
jgi:broad-specificity NMP kinase